MSHAAAMSGELDCLTCGACCRTGHDGCILVPEEDLVRWRRLGRNDLVLADHRDERVRIELVG